MKCDYKWMAPYILPPPSKRVTSIEQKCILEKDHEGPHRSLSNVIKYPDQTYTTWELNRDRR